jgi:selenide,water dikinase
MNVVAFPLKQLGGDVLREILRGGLEVVAEAGAALVGGHSIDDPEPKYGLAVTGVVDPGAMVTNAGGRAGDVLVLTKPLGVGAIVTARKRGAADDDVLAEAVEVMTTLNAAASAAAIEAGAHAMTDVTGFGLLGHLLEMCRGARLGARISMAAIPLLDDVASLAAAGFVTGASARNWASYGDEVRLAPQLEGLPRILLCDPQTSGGLLVACTRDAVDSVVDTLARQGCTHTAQIGAMSERAPHVTVDA